MPSLEITRDEEESLARGLGALARSLQEAHGDWAALLLEFVDRGRQLRAARASAVEWYDFAKSVARLFGGMGTLNDIDLDQQSERLKQELFSRVQRMLRRFWKELGRENHDGEVFSILPVGTEVRFVPGRPMYLEGDESFRVVPDQRWVHEQTWTIDAHGEPDITNMPTYFLRQGSKFMAVRCECVAPAT